MPGAAWEDISAGTCPPSDRKGMKTYSPASPASAVFAAVLFCDPRAGAREGRLKRQKKRDQLCGPTLGGTGLTTDLCSGRR